MTEPPAGHWRMARTCATRSQDEEFPRFADAEQALKQETLAQYQILEEFLTGN